MHSNNIAANESKAKVDEPTLNLNYKQEIKEKAV